MLSKRTAVRTLFRYKISLLLATLFLAGCVHSIPVEEYNIARAAVQAAKDADSPKYAPSLWHKADMSYRLGEKAFREKDYSEAKDQFELAREYSEQAENVSRISRFKSGDFVP